MVIGGGRKKLSPAREIAYVAVTVALLLGGQLVFSAVMGLEIVTLILAAFSFVFGARRGMFAAIAFSLLRCAIFGFYPAVVILYTLYYPLLSLVFGGLGHIKISTYEKFPLALFFIVNALILLLCGASLWGALRGVLRVSRLWRAEVRAWLWTGFGLFALTFAAFNILFIIQRTGKNCAQFVRLLTLCAVGALCTLSFSLMDDIISPLVLGMGRTAALGYFYASFTVMIPQTVCTILTVLVLFYPVISAMQRVKKL